MTTPSPPHRPRLWHAGRARHGPRRAQHRAHPGGLRRRRSLPAHIETHKSPLLAKLQVAAGAKGITCQKLGEAEVMADAGLDDILISYNLIGEEKMAARRAAARPRLQLPPTIRPWSRASEGGRGVGRPLVVVVDAIPAASAPGRDPGRGHCAGAPDRGLEKLSFAGFMLYPTETGWPTRRRS